MKETVTSLRWFFALGVIFWGFSIGVSVILGTIFGFGSLPGVLFSSPVSALKMLVGLGLAIMFCYFAIMLPKYLNPKKTKYLIWLIVGSFVWDILVAMYDFATNRGVDWIYLIVWGLITWYLYRNVRRLSSITSK